MMKVILVFGLVFFAVQAIELSERGKKCVKDIGTDEQTITDIMTKDEIDDSNEVSTKFMGCLMREWVTDSNTLNIDDTLIDYMTTICEKVTGEKTKISRLLAKECIYSCKDQTGATKDITAVNMMKCMMKTMFQFKKEE